MIAEIQTQAETVAEFVQRLQRGQATVGIVGLGYVGLPLVLLFSEAGFTVTGFDNDAEKVSRLNRGDSYMHHIKPEHVAAAQLAGFTAQSSLEAVGDLDVVLICVPTPLLSGPEHTPDMRFVVDTIEAIAPYTRAGQLIILESTTYPGTTEEIVVETLNRHGRARGLSVLRNGADRLDGLLVAFSPEREDPGNVTTSRRDIPKVVGGVSIAATSAACALYGTIFAQTVPMSTPAAAEMTKLLENIYRSVNIALVNELKPLCARMGIDIWEVIDAAATKPFGFQAFYPGPGVGGHCIPVDPFYLSWKAAQFGLETRFIQLAGEINEAMPEHVVETTAKALSERRIELADAQIMVLGLAYKRDVDDLRESPSLKIIGTLRARGAQVSYNDPFLPSVGKGRQYDLQMQSTALTALDRYDAVIIVTDHSTYDFAAIVEQSRLVIDTRNATQGIDSQKIVRC